MGEAASPLDMVKRTTRPARLEMSFRFRMLTRQMRLLPDFLLIGAMRSGTSYLHYLLTRHPSIAPAFTKEILFFSNCDGNYDKGLSWYRAHFPLKVKKDFSEKVRKQKFLTGEASPVYIYHPAVPQRILDVVPNAKLIAVLRNPIDRAYSQYNKASKYGNETLPFDEAVRMIENAPFEETNRIAVEGLEHSKPYWLKMRRDKYPRTEHSHNNAYLCWGVYVNYLEYWFKYFGKDEILVVRSEDMYEKPAQAMRPVFDFLELPHHEMEAYKPLYKPRDYQTMSPETRKRLGEYFRPHNERLYELLGRDMGWNE